LEYSETVGEHGQLLSMAGICSGSQHVKRDTM